MIIHANNTETVEYFKNSLKEKRPEIDEAVVLPLTAVVGAHAGPKTIGLGYYIKK